MGNNEVIKTDFDNKRAMIKYKGHPHYGEIAKCIGKKKTVVGMGFIFKSIETGVEFFVFDIKQVKFIE